MLEIDKPIIKPEDKVVAKPGERTTFLNEGANYNDLNIIHDVGISKPMNVRRQHGSRSRKYKTSN